MTQRCAWCGDNELLIRYHDEEWCREQVHDDRKLFEFMTLEMMQCGLSWLTVLKKREAMRAAFDNFAPALIARYDETRIAALMQNEEIIRSERKLRGMVKNARCFLDIAQRYGSFHSWLWGRAADEHELSAALKNDGFVFMGPVVVQSFMQAIGMVQGHEPSCFMYRKNSNS